MKRHVILVVRHCLSSFLHMCIQLNSIGAQIRAYMDGKNISHRSLGEENAKYAIHEMLLAPVTLYGSASHLMTLSLQ